MRRLVNESLLYALVTTPVKSDHGKAVVESEQSGANQNNVTFPHSILKDDDSLV
jgi:hypothetical protein